LLTKPQYLLVLFLSVALISACNGGDRHRNRADPNLRQFEGAKLVVLTNKHPWVDLISPRIANFSVITGIDVSLEVYPEEQFRIKRKVEMLSGISKVDLFMLMPGNSLDAYIKNDWVEALSPYLEDPFYSWPDYDFEDIFDTARKVGIRGEESYSLPIMLETSLLAYNKKILHKMGLSIPETMEELEDTAKAVFEGSNHQIYGITMRGKRVAATSQWIDFVHSFGGDWLTNEGKAALHTSKVLEATRYYGRLLRSYGPASAPSNGWYESTSLFMQEKAAMIYDANVFNTHYENPDVSQVAGNVGYVMIPAGPAGSVSHVSSWGLSLYKGSEHKGAALYFMQWATGKENSFTGLQKGIPAARKSAWQSLSGETEGLSEEWISASLESYNNALINWNPPIPDINKGRDIVSRVIIASILNRDLEQAAHSSSNLLNQLIEDENRIQK